MSLVTLGAPQACREYSSFLLTFPSGSCFYSYSSPEAFCCLLVSPLEPAESQVLSFFPFRLSN